LPFRDKSSGGHRLSPCPRASAECVSGAGSDNRAETVSVLVGDLPTIRTAGHRKHLFDDPWTCPSPLSRPSRKSLTLALRPAILRPMRYALRTVAVLRSALCTRRDLLLEILALRHQLGVRSRSDRRFRPLTACSGCACEGCGRGGGRRWGWSSRRPSPGGIAAGCLDGGALARGGGQAGHASSATSGTSFDA
jgi:hypothetical protein